MSGEGGVEVVLLLFSHAHYLLLAVNTLRLQIDDYKRVTLRERVTVRQVSAADKKVELALKTVHVRNLLDHLIILILNKL